MDCVCVRADELPHLFKWLHPQSTIVLVDRGYVRRLALAIEDILVELRIDTIYFLDRRIKFPEAVAKHQLVRR